MKPTKSNYRKEINKIAIPLIFSSLTSVCMGIIDQAFVGHISVYAYAGVGLVCSCINSLVGVLGAFSIAFNICGSRIKGENDQDGLNEEFTISCLLCGGSHNSGKRSLWQKKGKRDPENPKECNRDDEPLVCGSGCRDSI